MEKKKLYIRFCWMMATVDFRSSNIKWPTLIRTRVGLVVVKKVGVVVVEYLLLFFPKITSTLKHAFWKSFFKTTLNMVNQTCPIVFVSRSKKLNIKLLLQLTLYLSKGLFVLFLLLFHKLAFVLNMIFWNRTKEIFLFFFSPKRSFLKHDFWKRFFKTT